MSKSFFTFKLPLSIASPSLPARGHTFFDKSARQYFLPWSSPSLALGRVCRACSRKDGTQCGPRRAVTAGAAVLAALSVGALLSVLLLPAESRVLTEKLGKKSLKQTAPTGEVLKSLFERRGAQAGQAPSLGGSQLSVREQVSEVLRITEQAKLATKSGDFGKALECYTQITRRFPDLAITNYAKLGRALLLFQTGSKSQAILELEDLEVALRGAPEVHAALASAIYVERPSEISYAEEQFDLASEFDARYGDAGWVAGAKAWPPAMLEALDKFLHLR